MWLHWSSLHILVRYIIFQSDFFSSLLPRLFAFPTETLALQLSEPLLSRYVLLDPEANRKLLPSLLTPAKSESRQFYAFHDDSLVHSSSSGPREAFHPDRPVNPVLPGALFARHLVPLILKIMRVRELRIRSVLLE